MKITAILSVIAAASLVSAGKFHPEKKHTRVVPSTYIVEYEDGVRHNQAQNALKSNKVDFKLRNEYSVFNGASVSVKSGHDGEALAKIPGIKNVWHVTLYDNPKIQKSTKKPTDPEVAGLHSMTGVDVVHKKYKLTGKGIKIGVIDTGIDYKHPAFAAPGATEGCFARYGKNCRVAHGWDFVGDDYTGTDPKPDSDPMDCQGHGSHVAGIIGGNALNIKSGPKPPQPFVGVAPEVTFGAYRVFGCDGSAGDDVILAAMELAFNDGMDVINMSLGGGSSYKNNPIAILGDKLVARGMALAAAAGNDGSEGVWMVSDSGLGDLASSVASFDNISGRYDSFTYGGVAHPYSPSIAWAKPIDLAGATLIPVFEKDGSLSDGCDPALYTGLDVKGKVVLALGDVTRCKSGGRGSIAKTAGAAGILIQTTPYGLSSLGGNPDFPMGAIENKAGDDLIAVWKKTPAAAITFNKGQASFLIEGGGTPSDFSSIGLDGDLRSKPDVAAPGGNILSTYPLAQGGYAVLSGTSMATPYIAGAHAIYMQAKHKKVRGDVLRGVLKNTASIKSNFGSKTFTSAAKQGAGLVNVLNAILTTSSITPDHIDLLDTVNFKKTAKITLKNHGKHTETYTLSHVAADAYVSYDGNNTFPFPTPEIEAYSASVKFSADKIKIKAGQSAKITLSFKEPKKGNGKVWPLYSGFVIATPKSKGGIPVHIPYTGIKGDIRTVPIADTDLEFPVAQLVEGKDNYEDIPKDYVLDFTSSKKFAALLRLGSHSPDASIRVFDNKTKKFIGYVVSEDYGSVFGNRGRNPGYEDDGSLGFTVFKWGGKVVATKDVNAVPSAIPSGTYDIVVALQKNFSKGTYPVDYEVYNIATIKTA